MKSGQLLDQQFSDRALTQELLDPNKLCCVVKVLNVEVKFWIQGMKMQ